MNLMWNPFVCMSKNLTLLVLEEELRLLENPFVSPSYNERNIKKCKHWLSKKKGLPLHRWKTEGPVPGFSQDARLMSLVRAGEKDEARELDFTDLEISASQMVKLDNFCMSYGFLAHV